MIEYNVELNFNERSVKPNEFYLVSNDYNSIKFKFNSDIVTNKMIFKVASPSSKVYIEEIKNNEVILQKGFLVEKGLYQCEISVYGEDSKLTNYEIIKLNTRGEVADSNLATQPVITTPLLDRLVNEMDDTINEMNDTINDLNNKVNSGYFKGETGPQGPTGNGITSITKTSTSGLVDTYTITYTDGTTSTFQVTNGEDGGVTQEELDETNREVDYYKLTLNALPKVEGEGTSLTLDNTAEAPMKMSLAPSELSQDGEPTPETPQDIHNISGDNTIKVSNNDNTQEQSLPLNLPVKNKINIDDFVPATSASTITKLNTGINIKNTTNGYGAKINIENLKANTDYYISYKWENVSNGLNRVYVFAGSTQATVLAYLNNGTGFKFNTGNNTSINIWFYVQANSTGEVNYKDIQLEQGTKANSYTPYGTPALEYCKIGDYEDEFVYNTTDTSLELNKWYLKKNVGKVNINSFVATEESNVYKYTMNDYLVQNAFCDYFTNVVDSRITDNTQANNYLALEQFSFRMGSTHDRMYVKTSLTAEQLNALNSLFYYVSNTPQYILLNDTLQSQLTEIYNWVKAYQEQTNISQVNNDLPFVIKASALKDISNL